MAAKLDEIRAAAERVAGSHGLDVVDVEFAGPAKARVCAACFRLRRQTFEPIRNNRHWRGRLQPGGGGKITLDLSAVHQNSKSRKAGVNTVEIALENVEKAELIPEF